MWFQAPDGNQQAGLLVKRTNGSPYTQMSLMLGGTGTGAIGNGQTIHPFVIGADGSRWEVHTDADLADGGWHHLALVRPDTGFDPILYVDGQVAAVTFNLNSGTPPRNVNTTSPWAIGSNGSGSSRFTGMIDEVAMWNVALSSDNIMWLANHSLIELPEPTTFGLLGIGGLLGLFLARRKR